MFVWSGATRRVSQSRDPPGRLRGQRRPSRRHDREQLEERPGEDRRGLRSRRSRPATGPTRPPSSSMSSRTTRTTPGAWSSATRPCRTRSLPDRIGVRLATRGMPRAGCRRFRDPTRQGGLHPCRGERAGARPLVDPGIQAHVRDRWAHVDDRTSARPRAARLGQRLAPVELDGRERQRDGPAGLVARIDVDRALRGKSREALVQRPRHGRRALRARR